MLVNKVQGPLKQVLGVDSNRLTFGDMRKLFTAFRELMSLPEPTKENCPDIGSHILLDIKDDFFRHLNIGYAYQVMFRRLIDFVIGKRAYDNFYKQMLDWWIGEMLRRDYPLPGHNRPASVLWHTIPPATKKRLMESINDNYDLLQTRLKTIQEKLGDSDEGNIHRRSRYDQFANRILADVEREVVAWE